MIEWALIRLLGALCPACDERHHDLRRHWSVDHPWGLR